MDGGWIVLLVVNRSIFNPQGCKIETPRENAKVLGICDYVMLPASKKNHNRQRNKQTQTVQGLFKRFFAINIFSRYIHVESVLRLLSVASSKDRTTVG
jgi:hypothetical protein